MKTQNKVRMSMMAMGFAAALMVAGTARAQQEMDPTYFEVNPGTAAVQVASLDDAQSAPAAVQESDAPQSKLSMALQQDATMEAGMIRVAVIDAALAVMLVGGVVGLVAYAVWATRRERSSYAAQSEVPYHLPCNAARS